MREWYIIAPPKNWEVTKYTHVGMDITTAEAISRCDGCAVRSGFLVNRNESNQYRCVICPVSLHRLMCPCRSSAAAAAAGHRRKGGRRMWGNEKDLADMTNMEERV